jgi:hypothetical protein
MTTQEHVKNILSHPVTQAEINDQARKSHKRGETIPEISRLKEALVFLAGEIDQIRNSSSQVDFASVAWNDIMSRGKT